MRSRALGPLPGQRRKDAQTALLDLLQLKHRVHVGFVFSRYLPFQSTKDRQGRGPGAAAGAYLLQHVALAQGHEPPVKLHQLVRVGLERSRTATLSTRGRPPQPLSKRGSEGLEALSDVFLFQIFPYGFTASSSLITYWETKGR